MVTHPINQATKIGIIVIGFLILLVSCRIQDPGTKPVVYRFDQELKLRGTGLPTVFSDSLPQYATFFRIFNEDIARLGPDTLGDYPERLSQFLNDPGIIDLYHRVAGLNEVIEKSLQDTRVALARLSKIFAEEKAPTIVTYIGGFNQRFITVQGILGIGLEHYLGDTCSTYTLLGIPAYISARMRPENLEKDALRAWIYSELPGPPPEASFLDHLVYHGKVYAIMGEVLEKATDQELLQYTRAEAEWCLSNEKSMWRYLAEQQILFSTDRFLIRRFFDEAPFTRDFGKESPGRAGQWIGYRLIENYLKANKMNLLALVSQQDSRKILAESRYHP